MTQAHTHTPTEVVAALKLHGLRLTTAREEILSTLNHLASPATILEIAEKTDVDTATVYRNVATLTKLGIIEEISTIGHPSRFALAHGHHHDHIACTECGKLVHITCTMPSAPLPSHEQFATIDHHEVTYYGLCTNCSKA